MLVISAGVLALLAFAALSEAARRGSAPARVGAMVEGIALIPLAGLGLVRIRRYRWATAAMTLAAVSFGGWAAFMAPLGDRLGI